MRGFGCHVRAGCLNVSFSVEGGRGLETAFLPCCFHQRVVSNLWLKGDLATQTWLSLPAWMLAFCCSHSCVPHSAGCSWCLGPQKACPSRPPASPVSSRVSRGFVRQLQTSRSHITLCPPQPLLPSCLSSEGHHYPPSSQARSHGSPAPVHTDVKSDSQLCPDVWASA